MYTITNRSSAMLQGFRDGIPIGLGYFAVGFSVGIAARNIGMTAWQGFFMSMLNNASAGEYAGIAAMKAGSAYISLALLILITNARYLLMSTALSQKLPSDMPIRHRLLIGFDVTDELFGIAIARPGFIHPYYMYGAYIIAIPMWSAGTGLGVAAGNLLPAQVVTALSAAIYGMFLAVVIPPCRTDRRILTVVLVSFAASSIFTVLPYVSELSESMRIILLTLIISVAAALIRPVSDNESSSDTAEAADVSGQPGPDCDLSSREAGNE